MALWSREEVTAVLTSWRDALEAPQYRGFQTRAYMYERFIELCGGTTNRALSSFSNKHKSLHNTALIARAYNDRKLAKRLGAYAPGIANLPWFRLSPRRKREWFDSRNTLSYGYVELEPETYAELMELIDLADECEHGRNLCHRRVHLRRNGSSAPWEAVPEPPVQVRAAVELAAAVLASTSRDAQRLQSHAAPATTDSTSSWSRNSTSVPSTLTAAAVVADYARDTKDGRTKHAFAPLTPPVELDEMFTATVSSQSSSSARSSSSGLSATSQQQQQIVIDDDSDGSSTESDSDVGGAWGSSGDDTVEDNHSRSSNQRSQSVVQYASDDDDDTGTETASSAASRGGISALWTMASVCKTPTVPAVPAVATKQPRASSPALEVVKSQSLPLRAAAGTANNDEEHAMVPINDHAAVVSVNTASMTTETETATAEPSTLHREPNRELLALVHTLEMQSLHLHEMLVQSKRDRLLELRARERDQRKIDSLVQSMQALSDKLEANQAEQRADREQRMSAEKARFEAQTRALVEMRRYAFDEREALVRDFGIKQARWEMRSAHQLQELEGLRLEVAKLQHEARVREVQLAAAKALRATTAQIEVVRAASPLPAENVGSLSSPPPSVPQSSPTSSQTQSQSTSLQVNTTLDIARLGTMAGSELEQARELNRALLAEALGLGNKKAAKRSSASKTLLPRPSQPNGSVTATSTSVAPPAPVAAATATMTVPPSAESSVTTQQPPPIASKPAASSTKRASKKKAPRQQLSRTPVFHTEEARLAAEKRRREEDEAAAAKTTTTVQDDEEKAPGPVATTLATGKAPSAKKQKVADVTSSSPSTASSTAPEPFPRWTRVKSPHTVRGKAVYFIQGYRTEEAYLKAAKRHEKKMAKAEAMKQQTAATATLDTADSSSSSSTPSSPATSDEAPQSPPPPISSEPMSAEASSKNALSQPQSKPPRKVLSSVPGYCTVEARLRAEKEQADKDAAAATAAKKQETTKAAGAARKRAAMEEAARLVAVAVAGKKTEAKKTAAATKKREAKTTAAAKKKPNVADGDESTESAAVATAPPMPFPRWTPVPGSEFKVGNKMYRRMQGYRTEEAYLEAVKKHSEKLAAEEKEREKAAGAAAAKTHVEADASSSSSAAALPTARDATLQPPPSTSSVPVAKHSRDKSTLSKTQQKKPRKVLSTKTSYRTEEARLKAEKAQAMKDAAAAKKQAVPSSTDPVSPADAPTRLSTSTTATFSQPDPEAHSQSSTNVQSAVSKDQIAIPSDMSAEAALSSSSLRSDVPKDAREPSATVSPRSSSSPELSSSSSSGSGDNASQDKSADATATEPPKRARKRKQEPTTIQRKAAQYIMLPEKVAISNVSSPVRSAVPEQLRDATPSKSPPPSTTEQPELSPPAVAATKTSITSTTAAAPVVSSNDLEPAQKKTKVATPTTDNAPAPSARNTKAPESRDSTTPSDAPRLSTLYAIRSTRSETQALAKSRQSAVVPDAVRSGKAPAVPLSTTTSGAEAPAASAVIADAPTRKSSRVKPPSKEPVEQVRVPLRKLSTAKPPPSSKPTTKTPVVSERTSKRKAAASSSSSSSKRSKAASSSDVVSGRDAPADAKQATHVTNENTPANVSKAPPTSAKTTSATRKTSRVTEQRETQPTPAVTSRPRRSRK